MPRGASKDGMRHRPHCDAGEGSRDHWQGRPKRGGATMARHRSLTTHVAMCCHLIVQDRVLGFSRTVSALPMSLTGIDRLEAVHRAYEAALCATPHPYLDDVHAAM